jgi:hypothetical protein
MKARIWVKRAIRCGLEPWAVPQPSGGVGIVRLVPHGPLKSKNPPTLADIRSHDAVVRELMRAGRGVRPTDTREAA